MSISTKWSRTFSALILIAWVFVLLGSANVASALPPEVPENEKPYAGEQAENTNQNQTRPGQNVLARQPFQTPQENPPATNAEQHRIAEAEQRIATFTRALVIVGIFQFIAASVYALFAIRQWREIRRQANIAEQSSRVAQQTLVLAYRPKLIVRNVVMEQPDMRNWTVPQDIKPDQLFIWRLYVSNIGGSPATVTETGCWIILVLGELPMERPYEGRNGNTVITGMKGANKLFPGEFGTLHIALLGERVEGGEDPLKSLQGYRKQLHIYVMGWVTYADDIAIVRRTAFCRRYDWARQYFVAVANPDYEHAE